MPRVFTTWCPFGEMCNKKGRQLCKFDTETKCRDFVMNHLTRSPYHRDAITEEDAAEAAVTCEVQMWDDEEQ